MTAPVLLATPAPRDCVVTDDDPSICALIARHVGKIGVTSRDCPSAGAMAKALAGGHPDVVFLDVALDRSDAIDGIRILRETGFRGAVQLISGREDALLEDIRSIGEKNGLSMLAPLRKPFRGEELRRIFEACDGGRTPPPRLAAGAEQVSMPRVDLAEALARDWVRVAYQPKVHLTSGRVTGAEGLARVRHPTHGELPPAAFLPGAGAGTLERLAEFMAFSAFRDWEALHRRGRNLEFAVNAPVSVLTGTGLCRVVREERPKNPAWPGLVIELTEDEAIGEFDAVLEAAVQLRIYNLRLAIDDFGAGYSSFARLKQLPFCELKLDRGYVRDVAGDRLNAGICQSIIALADASGAASVAEGIETQADRNALAAMGCDFGQGYLFGRPMSLDRLSALLSRRR